MLNSAYNRYCNGDNVPQKTQRSVTLRKDVYDLAKTKAETKNKSISRFVTDLILENVEVPANG